MFTERLTNESIDTIKLLCNEQATITKHNGLAQYTISCHDFGVGSFVKATIDEGLTLPLRYAIIYVRYEDKEVALMQTNLVDFLVIEDMLLEYHPSNIFIN